MSVNFHANQYEQAFDPKRIQNWEVPKNTEGKYPKTREGFSTIHANSRGHLLPGVPRERASPWGTFVGTWDMPTKIPGNKQLNPTARSENAQLKLEMNKMETSEVMSGGLKKTKIPSPLPVKIDQDALPENNPAPCIMPPSPGGATYQAVKGTLTPPNLPMTHQSYSEVYPRPPWDEQQVMWPNQGRVGDRDQPVGNAASPKPPTPMPLGGEAVQNDAAQRVSPVNPEQVAVRGAVASPIEPVTGQMRTPEANVNWPMARSAEPPEI